MRRPDMPGITPEYRAFIRSVFCLSCVVFQPIFFLPIFLGLVVHVAWDYHCDMGAHGSLRIMLRKNRSGKNSRKGPPREWVFLSLVDRWWRKGFF